MEDTADRLPCYERIDTKGHILATLFRPAFLRALFENRHYGMIREMGLMPLAQAGASIREFFDWVYSKLCRSYRCEYVYKNEILHRLFLARHNLATATTTSEFLIGNNRLDLLVLNGTTVAYEVKTDYDDLARLPRQMAAYLSVFDRINVVCAPDLAERVLSLVDQRVGVVSLNPKGSLAVRRSWESNADKVCPEAIFNLLRAPEYIAAVRRLFGVSPEVPNTQRRKVYLGYFRTLPPKIAHRILLESLRTRLLDPQPERVRLMPYSMIQMYYEATTAYRARMFDIISQPLL